VTPFAKLIFNCSYRTSKSGLGNETPRRGVCVVIREVGVVVGLWSNRARELNSNGSSMCEKIYVVLQRSTKVPAMISFDTKSNCQARCTTAKP